MPAAAVGIADTSTDPKSMAKSFDQLRKRSLESSGANGGGSSGHGGVGGGATTNNINDKLESGNNNNNINNTSHSNVQGEAKINQSNMVMQSVSERGDSNESKV